MEKTMSAEGGCKLRQDYVPEVYYKTGGGILYREDTVTDRISFSRVLEVYR